MPKRQPEIRIRTHGIYKDWRSENKDLPEIQEITTRVPAQINIEFGFIASIKFAKNREMAYCIDHPGIRDEAGKRRPAFHGFVYVKTNDWNFYLGDTIWEPIADKLGDWRMWLALENEIVAEKTFDIFSA